MFDEVLVGVDDYAGGRRALELAAVLTASAGRITLVYVEVVQTAPDPQLDAASVSERQRFGLERLRRLRDASRIEAGVTRTQAASISGGLHELARRRHADLIVIGASNRNLVARSQFGDDIREVLHEPPCPVAVAPHDYPRHPGQIRTIGVGYDGSPSSERALAVARDLAAEHDAVLLAYEAVAAPIPVAVRWTVENEIDGWLDKERDRLAALGDVEAHAELTDDPVAGLGQFAPTVDLLVLGSPGTIPPGRHTPPSTAQQVAERAPSPVLALAAPDQATAG